MTKRLAEDRARSMTWNMVQRGLTSLALLALLATLSACEDHVRCQTDQDCEATHYCVKTSLGLREASFCALRAPEDVEDVADPD